MNCLRPNDCSKCYFHGNVVYQSTFSCCSNLLAHAHGSEYFCRWQSIIDGCQHNKLMDSHKNGIIPISISQFTFGSVEWTSQALVQIIDNLYSVSMKTHRPYGFRMHIVLPHGWLCRCAFLFFLLSLSGVCVAIVTVGALNGRQQQKNYAIFLRPFLCIPFFRSCVRTNNLCQLFCIECLSLSFFSGSWKKSNSSFSLSFSLSRCRWLLCPHFFACSFSLPIGQKINCTTIHTTHYIHYTCEYKRTKTKKKRKNVRDRSVYWHNFDGDFVKLLYRISCQSFDSSYFRNGYNWNGILLIDTSSWIKICHSIQLEHCVSVCCVCSWHACNVCSVHHSVSQSMHCHTSYIIIASRLK